MINSLFSYLSRLTHTSMAKGLVLIGIPIKILSLIIHCRRDNSYIIYQDFCWNAKTRHCLVPWKITLFRWYRGLPSATHKFSTEKYRDLLITLFWNGYYKTLMLSRPVLLFLYLLQQKFYFSCEILFPLK